MSTGPHLRWRRYAEAVLLLLGGAYRPGPRTTWAYDLLLLPTFHAPASITVAQDGDETWLIVALLDDPPLLQAATQILLGSPSNRPHAGSATRRDEIVLLDAQQRGLFSAEIARLRPFDLDNIDLASRDGLGLRCDCWRGTEHHTFWMHSPTLDETPRHAQLVAALLTLAADQCSDPLLQSHLHALQRYLH